MARSGLLEARREQKAARRSEADDDAVGETAGGAPATDPDDWAWELAPRWHCRCGYVNAGFDRCASCGSRDPEKGTRKRSSDPRAMSALEAWERPGDGTSARTTNARVGGKAGRTVAAVVLLNVGISVASVVLAVAGRLQTGEAIRLSLFTGLVFYAVTAMWVRGRAVVLGVRPVVSRGSALTGAAEGAVVGGALAIILVAVARLVAGHPVLDPVASFLVSETLGPMLIGLFVLVVAAPVVEELVFRGFLAEALRRRGTRVAGLLSAAAFGMAHLRFSQFRYYLGMGMVFVFLYWRRGLVASVSAHAAFNGMLVVAALAVAHGPALTLSGAGASMTVPGTWQAVDPPVDSALAAMGPSGAVIELGSIGVDTGGAGPEVLARNLAAGAVPLPPGLFLDPASVGIMDLPAGRAVSVNADVYGQDGRMVALLRGDRLWIATITTGGSDQARRDFSDALQTLRLP